MIYLMMIDTEEDKRKFVILYESYRRLMRKVVQDVLHDEHQTEDVLHESFIKIAKNIKNIGDPYSKESKNYVVVIAKHTAIDVYRQNKRRWAKEICVDEIKDHQVPPTYIKSDVDADHRVLDILRDLPENYKTVLMLKFVNRFENKDIAKMLGISEENVRQRISRGKRMVETAVREMNFFD